MSIVEEHIWNGQPSVVTWLDKDFMPPRSQITQASGICFTDDGLVVLVSTGDHWSLPGGTTEEGETIEETLVREVWEEACARVVNHVYLGSQEVREIREGEKLPPYYQVRFWARVVLDEFKGEYEISERKLVTLDSVNAFLQWKPSGILEAIMKAALECESKFGFKAD